MDAAAEQAISRRSSQYPSTQQCCGTKQRRSSQEDRHRDIDGKRIAENRGTSKRTCRRSRILCNNQENLESDNSKNHDQNFFDPVAILTIEQLKSFDDHSPRTEHVWLGWSEQDSFEPVPEAQ